eukprot:460270-Rhodomonas_salina.1
MQLEPGKLLTKKDSPEFVDPALHQHYHGFVGHLSFLVQMTQPDLVFAFSELSKFVQSPGQAHWKAALRTLQYLWGTYDKGITYSDPGPEQRDCIKGWVDLDYAADPDTHSSVTRYVLSMNNGPVSWRSKRQSCTTLSSQAEAEFVAASICCQEMSENPTHADRACYIDMHLYFLRDMVRNGVVKLIKVSGTENVADALTNLKSLPAPAFEKYCQYLWGSGVPFSSSWVTLPAWESLASFKITIHAWEMLRPAADSESMSL